MKNLHRGICLAALAGLVFTVTGCTRHEASPWAARNQAVIDEHKVTGRTRELPEVKVPLALADGEAVLAANLPTANLAPGVDARLAWGRGALLEHVTFAADAAYPAQKLDEELIIVVTRGAATVEVDGKTLELTKDTALFLEPGSTRTMKAGAQGLETFEVYSPVRLDHLALVGQDISGAKPGFPDLGVKPSHPAGVVINVNEIQWTPLTDPSAELDHPRSIAHARLIWGRNAQVSMVRMDPGATFVRHIHPEDQLSYTLRGSLEQGVMDTTYTADDKGNHVVNLPGGMVHSARMSDTGADQFDVFWPVRPDYIERASKQQALYAEVIEPGTQPRKLAEGFTFAEGPTWLNGKLYFSDMYFKDHKAGDWTGSPQRSRLIVMEPDGKWRVLATGMQSNGTIAAANGNLIVCDMFGHRVVEVNPATGKVVKVLFDRIDGKPLDGPNDMVMDARGGLYVTDPQFTPEEKKTHPGPQLYYVAPDGKARIVVPAGEFAFPNGVELSPDGKTVYVNNSWNSPGQNFVWAYDVAEDGSLSNKRRFAQMNLEPDVLSAPNPDDRFASSGDGTAVDTDGRYYVATKSGVQIFKPDGTFIGNIWAPQYPVNVTFGGPDNNILYMVGESSAWMIPTRVKGFRHPAGL
ncbi:MAG TPA: SMP-30/gluconolactonase/LRE family protein [Steroidobacteraceae bacterium]|nr:SMP-30/gluconolactonase/LRE family protein [Steroidobacteraceae bacterium]